ncbi:hypothetical protein AXF42_Ash010662 [Apostasia shenzhenica]|uniref:Protein FATTY ACID EXPORT 1, chloroplastic n=1 Tax=Apostasia shenzhenica TaxID=1088818 RepID=A0A2I0A6P3_9ASPA|nr:hypothetical protein AXF42_Ash010662 [Apostasia shenzhenica]
MAALHFSSPSISYKKIMLGRYLCSSTSQASSLRSISNMKHVHGVKMLNITRVKPFVSMCLNGSNTRVPGYEENNVLTYAEDHIDKTTESYPLTEQHAGKVGPDMHANQEDAVQTKSYAKIHDFCLGIPYGGFLFAGGLFGFLFSRNPVSLATSMLGAAILGLAAVSLKVWRKGLSSIPFMFGQAALSAALLVKHFRSYSLTKKAFPSGLYIFISAGMLCFYSYVLFAGGNPPPKKKLAAA